jgi:hypothetical protein
VQGQCTYAPKAVQVVVCNHHEQFANGGAREHSCPVGEPAEAAPEGWSQGGYVWASPIFSVQNESVLQVFQLPPLFAADAVVRVRFCDWLLVVTGIWSWLCGWHKC